MPSDSLPCPLCKEPITRNKLGGHLLSRKHQEAVRSLNTKAFPALQKQVDFLLDPPKHPNWPDLPSITFSSGTAYYCCFGCKGCWVNQPYCHFSTNKECRTKHAKGLKVLMDPSSLTGEDRVKELEAEVASLKAALAAKPSGTPPVGSVSVGSEKLEELQSQYDDLEAENAELIIFFRRTRKLLAKMMNEDLGMELVSANERMAFLLETATTAVAPVPEPPAAPAPPPAPKIKESLVEAALKPSFEEAAALIDKMTPAEMKEYHQRMAAKYAAPKAPPLPAAERDVETTRPFQDPVFTNMLGPGVKLLTVTRPGKKVMPRSTVAGL